jgi:hypothetical protein
VSPAKQRFVLHDSVARQAARALGFDVKNDGEVTYIDYEPPTIRNRMRTGRAVGTLAHNYLG